MEPVISLIDRIVDLLRDPTSGVFVISLAALLVAGLAVYSMATLVKQRGSARAKDDIGRVGTRE